MASAYRGHGDSVMNLNSNGIAWGCVGLGVLRLRVSA